MKIDIRMIDRFKKLAAVLVTRSFLRQSKNQKYDSTRP